jgi:hypothetical protein
MNEPNGLRDSLRFSPGPEHEVRCHFGEGCTWCFGASLPSDSRCTRPSPSWVAGTNGLFSGAVGSAPGIGDWHALIGSRTRRRVIHWRSGTRPGRSRSDQPSTPGLPHRGARPTGQLTPAAALPPMRIPHNAWHTVYTGAMSREVSPQVSYSLGRSAVPSCTP